MLTHDQLSAFQEALDNAKQGAVRAAGKGDVRQILRVEIFAKVCFVLGLLVAWPFPNPLAVLLLDLAIVYQWIVMHHVSHGAYEGLPGTPRRYGGSRFAAGIRRFWDWLDWVHPSAWRYVHNGVHHPDTAQGHDPDLVELNLYKLRDLSWPTPLKFLMLSFMAMFWRILYYPPTTWFHYEGHRRGLKAQSFEPLSPLPKHFLDLSKPEVRGLWWHCYLPVLLVRYTAVPLLFYPLGWSAVLSVLLNLVLAELASNLHLFFLVPGNHAFTECYRFSESPQSRGEYYLQQILATVNYRPNRLKHCGYLYLSLHIEHHLWPNLTLRSYERVQPEVRCICGEFGVPYKELSFLNSVKETVSICVGRTSMTPWCGPMAQGAAKGD